MFLSKDDDQALPVNELSAEDREILHKLVGIWTDLRNGEDTGATTWEVLEQLERDVTDALSHATPDVRRAERLTAKAMFLMVGFESD